MYMTERNPNNREHSDLRRLLSSILFSEPLSDAPAHIYFLDGH